MTTTNKESTFEKKKRQYVERIDLIAKESFNNEQKEIAKQIIEGANENNIDAVYQLVTQRVKTGFVFDAAPEVNHNCVALVKENDSLNIVSNEAIQIEHSLIIGENYDALKNLISTYINRSTGEGMIDIIYIDPPYNTESAKKDGNNYKEEIEATKFVYRDKFTRDGWLNLINERLLLSKKLMKKDGIICVSVDDNEQAYLKILMDEIFGENNFVSALPRSIGAVSKKVKTISNVHDYVLIYSKRDVFMQNTDLEFSHFRYKDKIGEYALIHPLDNGGLGYIPSLDFPIEINGKTYTPGMHDNNNITKKYRWTWGKDRVEFGLNNNLLVEKGNRIYIKDYKEYTINKSGESFVLVKKEAGASYKSDYLINEGVSNRSGTRELNSIIKDSGFPYPKPSNLVKSIIKLISDKNSIVLDFFAGSGTTGQAVMELNHEDDGSRKFILVTNNENNIATDVTWERLYRVIYGKGSKGEQIDWKYSDSLSSLLNNSVKVFEIEYHELELNDFEKAKQLIPIAEKQFKKLNPNYKAKDRFDIYNELAALNPYKKV